MFLYGIVASLVTIFSPARGPVLVQLFRQFLADESGATAIEYAFFLGLIAVAIVGSLNTLRGGMINMYDFVSSEVDEVINGSP